MDSAIAFAKDTVCCIFHGLYQHINHLRRLGEDVRHMQHLLDALNATKTDINNCLEREGREALAVVKNWMVIVDSNVGIVGEIRRDYDLHTRCLFGCCPDCVFMLRLSSRVRDCITIIQRLSDDGKFESLNGQFGDVPRGTELVPASQLVGQTPQTAQAVIQGWLADHNTGIIGIYGIGGVGKTSLVENINNNSEIKPRFDVVIFVTVSQDGDIKTVQNSIAARLGLSLPESAEERRIKLFNYLQKKRYLLILDDVWENIDLKALGVGKPSTGDGRKIVLTTRDRRVCLEMGADKEYELKTLSQEEAWELFRREARLGDGIMAVMIERIAKDLAAHCDGLPLAINCIATAVRGCENDIQQWKSASNQLQSVDDTRWKGLEHLKTLRLSYEFLPPHLKPCFLHCALYRVYSKFESLTSKRYSLELYDEVINAESKLIPMWIAEGLLTGGSREELYGRGHDFINFMRDRNMVQPIRSEVTGRCGWVRVHDVLKDLAIQIGKMEKTCLYGGGGNVTQFPFQEAEIVGCQRISLIGTNMVSLPTDFKCQTLVSLVLRGNQGLDEIPEGVLRNLPSLKVLDLRKTNIKSLPSSVGLLKQLVYRDLSRTNIEELPESTGELTCLQFLNLGLCSELTSLPSRISDLKSLKYLILQSCEKLRVLRREISQLTSLESLELYGSNIFIGEGSAEMEMEMNEICLKDLRNLNCLRELSLQVKSPITEETTERWMDMKALLLDCSHINQEELPENMQRMIQLEYFYLRYCKAERLPDWICKFEYLSHLALTGSEQLTELPELQRLPSLRTLVIKSCSLLRELRGGGGSNGGFPMLEYLFLYDLTSLETVVGPSLEGGVMPNLQRLIVRECPELRKLPWGMEKLQKLEEIRGTQDWWNAIIWEDERMREGLRNYFVEWAKLICGGVEICDPS